MRNLLIAFGLLISPFILWLMLLPQASNAFTGVTLDNVASSTISTGPTNSITLSFTVGSFTDEVLVVFVANNASVVTTGDYNGTSLTEVVGARVTTGALITQAFYVVAPTTGAHTITINGTNMTNVQIVAANYYNVKQTGIPDSSTGNLSTAAPTSQLDTALTTVANNVMGIQFTAANNLGSTVSGSCANTRGTGGNGNLYPDYTLCDGAVTPAGSYTYSVTNSSSNRMLVSMIGLTPDTQPSTFSFWQFFEF